jgi:hypothetical protein
LRDSAILQTRRAQGCGLLFNQSPQRGRPSVSPTSAASPGWVEASVADALRDVPGRGAALSSPGAGGRVRACARRGGGIAGARVRTRRAPRLPGLPWGHPPCTPAPVPSALHPRPRPGPRVSVPLHPRHPAPWQEASCSHCHSRVPESFGLLFEGQGHPTTATTPATTQLRAIPGDTPSPPPTASTFAQPPWSPQFGVLLPPSAARAPHPSPAPLQAEAPSRTMKMCAAWNLSKGDSSSRLQIPS